MIRPGIMVYGYFPDATQTPRNLELRQAITWKSVLSLVKRVPAGETVGYGRTWTAPTDRWIGTVPVGYADGYSRLNSNRVLTTWTISRPGSRCSMTTEGQSSRLPPMRNEPSPTSIASSRPRPKSGRRRDGISLLLPFGHPRLFGAETPRRGLPAGD